MRDPSGDARPKPRAWPRRVLLALLLCTSFLAACGSTERDGSARRPISPSPGGGILSEIAPETRTSRGGAEPRTSGYWVIWSTCGEGSQADVAEANGGREAGYVLVDDLLEDPGIVVGGYRLRSCEAAVRVLEGAEATDDVSRLAAQSLTAELNLSAGAESCVAAEGVVSVARVFLGAVSYAGPGAYELQDDSVTRARETIELLAAYNQGKLCVDG